MGAAFLALGLSHSSARAEAAERSPRQYEAIAKRNLFGLKEPEPAPSVAPPPVALPKIFLAGISTLDGRKRVFLKRLGVARQGAPATGEESFMLFAGQKEGDIEVLEIDEVAGRVRINQAGTELNLDFEKDAPKSNPPVVANGQPPALPNPNAMATSNPAMNPPPAVAPNPNAPLNAAQPGFTPKRMLPTRVLPPPAPLPLPGAPSPAASTPANPLTDAEAQQILQEAQRLKANPNPY